MGSIGLLNSVDVRVNQKIMANHVIINGLRLRVSVGILLGLRAFFFLLYN